MKKINLTNFIRKDIAGMVAYAPVKYIQQPSEIAKLDAGENQFGYSPRVADVLKNSQFFNFYPDPEYKELRKAIAKYVGTSINNIMVGSGSDELLDLLFRLILEQGDKIINCPPTFGMYSVLTDLNKGIVISVPRNSDFSLNIKGIKNNIDEKVKAIIVCTPNNPTGTVSSKNEIISLLKTGKLVIVDEACVEFYGESAIPLLTKYENLIVLRTFSKWAGLAGLRLGYGVMSAYFIKQLFKIKPPYNVNVAACYAGIAALSDLNYSKKIIQTIVKERKRVAEELGKLSYLLVYPSESNSLFIRVNGNILKLKNYLECNKISVRYYDSEIRLSIGKPEQNNKVIRALQTYEKA